VLDAAYEGVSVALQGQLKVLVSLWSGNVLVHARIDSHRYHGGQNSARVPSEFCCYVVRAKHLQAMPSFADGCDKSVKSFVDLCLSVVTTAIIRRCDTVVLCQGRLLLLHRCVL
jgi:hypothetical protein